MIMKKSNFDIKSNVLLLNSTICTDCLWYSNATDQSDYCWVQKIYNLEMESNTIVDKQSVIYQYLTAFVGM